MGKGKKKKTKKSEFDDFFESAPTEAQWLSGVAAAAMDTDDNATPAVPAVAAPAGEAMDTAEGRSKPSMQLGVMKSDMKRGQRTVNQKKRRNMKLGKALAINERLSDRVSKEMATKQRKARLKGIY